MAQSWLGCGQLQFADIEKSPRCKSVVLCDVIILGIPLARHFPVMNCNVHLRAGITIPRNRDAVNLGIMK